MFLKGAPFFGEIDPLVKETTKTDDLILVSTAETTAILRPCSNHFEKISIENCLDVFYTTVNPRYQIL